MYFLSQKLYTENETCLKEETARWFIQKKVSEKWLDEVWSGLGTIQSGWMFSSVATHDTLDNTVEILEDGSTFVLTGDIPAMWLRDSTAQLRPYLHVAKEMTFLRQTIAGLVKRQMTLILKDPYANSLTLRKTGRGTTRLTTDLNGWI